MGIFLKRKCVKKRLMKQKKKDIGIHIIGKICIREKKKRINANNK